MELAAGRNSSIFPVCSFRWLLSAPVALTPPFWELGCAVMHLIFKSSLPWGRSCNSGSSIRNFSRGKVESCWTGYSNNRALWSSLETLCGLCMPQDGCDEQWPKTIFLPSCLRGKNKNKIHLTCLLGQFYLLQEFMPAECELKHGLKHLKKTQFNKLWTVSGHQNLLSGLDIRGAT